MCRSIAAMRCFLYLRGNPENLKRSAVSMINMVKLPTKKSNLFPVSYTHLDVYKRQSLKRLHRIDCPAALAGKMCSIFSPAMFSKSSVASSFSSSDRMNMR